MPPTDGVGEDLKQKAGRLYRSFCALIRRCLAHLAKWRMGGESASLRHHRLKLQYWLVQDRVDR